MESEKHSDEFTLYACNLGEHLARPHEHADFEEYRMCKGLLFQQCRHGIVNKDDENLEELLKGHTCTIETYGFDKTADLYAEDLELVKKPGELGIDFLVKSNVKDAPADFRVEVPTPGRFSVYNALTAIAVCRHFKVSVPQIQKALLSAHVRGRIERRSTGEPRSGTCGIQRGRREWASAAWCGCAEDRSSAAA